MFFTKAFVEILLVASSSTSITNNCEKVILLAIDDSRASRDMGYKAPQFETGLLGRIEICTHRALVILFAHGSLAQRRLLDDTKITTPEARSPR